MELTKEQAIYLEKNGWMHKGSDIWLSPYSGPGGALRFESDEAWQIQAMCDEATAKAQVAEAQFMETDALLFECLNRVEHGIFLGYRSPTDLATAVLMRQKGSHVTLTGLLELALDNVKADFKEQYDATTRQFGPTEEDE